MQVRADFDQYRLPCDRRTLMLSFFNALVAAEQIICQLDRRSPMGSRYVRPGVAKPAGSGGSVALPIAFRGLSQSDATRDSPATRDLITDFPLGDREDVHHGHHA
jgi:hypothetical protein